MNARSRPHRELHAPLVLGLLFVLCILGLGRDLWTPDEPREAEISREMWLAPGVVPTLNGKDFVEKPPLYYWIVAAVFGAVGPSPAAARSVSAAASFLTLLLVSLWGRRELSSAAGLAAALGLATSTQFLISSHWIVMDPLLMLFTTAALWAAFELARKRGSEPVFRGTRETDSARQTRSGERGSDPTFVGKIGSDPIFVFYAALTLALWTKGLIGPVLLACGLAAYAAVRRSLEPIRRVRPILGIVVLSAMTGVIAALIYFRSGLADVREWLYVNHVQRFVDPSYTGHDQPFYYYLSAVPIAVFPWWVPFASLLRPSAWRAAAARPTRDFETYLGAVSLGMVLILSASATKRALYLLPMLPPLFLLLAARAEAWWRARPAGRLGTAWALQGGLVVLFAAAPTVALLIYLRRADAAAAASLAAVGLGTAALAAVGLGTAALVACSRRGAALSALTALAAVAVVGVVSLLVVDTRLAAPFKDLTPFVTWVSRQVPPGATLAVTGDVDETVRGIVPFVTGARVVETMPSEIPGRAPLYVLVQDKNGGRTATRLPQPYERVAERRFGPGRYLALWRRAESDAVPGAPPPADTR